MAEEAIRVHYHTCPLCEATCGLEVHTRGREVLAIRGDREDPLSRGFLCPKGYSLIELDADPDRLRRPLVRRGDRFAEVSWEEAFAEVERGLKPVIAQHGADAVGVYLGNPNVHTLAGALYVPVFLRALGTKRRFSASTVDQMPKQVAVAMMYGNGFAIPVPDIDRTDFLLILGANPLVSNGSLWTAPDLPGRIKALQERGGRLVVIDPVRTRTAQAANEHHFIRPGTDGLFLFGLVHTLFAEGLANPGRLAQHIAGLEEVEALARAFSPERVAEGCGIPAATIRRLARELAGAKAAAVYGRMGTCTQPFGTLNSWLIELVNILTGNLDWPGGAMFPKPAAGGRTGGSSGRGHGVRFGRFESRARGLKEVLGELPVAALAEEIETPGEGQVRALVTIAGNPVLTTPNSGRLDRALAGLDFMVSVDPYLNETTRHANVILPVPSPLERSHYDITFYHLSVRNIAHYSPAVFEKPAGQPDEWQILLRLTAIVSGRELGPDPVGALDDATIRSLITMETASAHSVISGRDSAEIMAALGPERGPERMLDFLLRIGPYGEGFGANPQGLSLARVKANPHGIDLGALEPRIPEVLRTPSGKIELAPPAIVADAERLRALMAQGQAGPGFRLVGRRHLRSNNSWMHNLPVLMTGSNRCTLWIHPADAAGLGLTDGETATVTSRVGRVQVVVEVTDAVMPGVVSLPHGWGHELSGVRLQVAQQHPGQNANLLSDEEAVDPLSGNAVLNGIPVSIARGV